MKVLIMGSGGREHALAEAFNRSKRIREVIVSPGNAGIALQFRCEPFGSFEQIKEFCVHEPIDLVFIGPEQYIADGLSDYLRLYNIPVIAPSSAAARLESSKMFAKQLMQSNNIPTARFVIATSRDVATKAILDMGFPVVIKADGLAAGKGVSIVHNLSESQTALEQLFPAAGSGQGAVIEEYLDGWEVSLFAVCDGSSYASMVFAQDHKQLHDYDQGPNTGGMGAFAPVPEAEAYRRQIEKEIIEPTLSAMQKLGYPYEGILYCGLMICQSGPRVIEFNCRFGDPEAQVVLPLLKNDLCDVCISILEKKVQELNLEFTAQTALGVVLASPGYPGKYTKGMPITMPVPLPEGVYFSGVARKDNSIICAGGRVLSLVSTGKDLNAARTSAYQKLKAFSFAGMSFRHDIGLRQNTL